MDITEKKGLWRVTNGFVQGEGFIEHRPSGHLRLVKNMPGSNILANMAYRTFMKKCRMAYNTGQWPE